MLECQLCGMRVKHAFRYASRCPAWPSVRFGTPMGGNEFHDWKPVPAMVKPATTEPTIETLLRRIDDLTAEVEEAEAERDALRDVIAYQAVMRILGDEEEGR